MFFQQARIKKTLRLVVFPSLHHRHLVLSLHSWQSLSNPLGKIGCRVSLLSDSVDQRSSLEVSEGQRLPHATVFVDILRGMAAQENFPTEGQRLRIHPGMHEDVGCAVGRQRVVKLRLSFERINFGEVVKEDSPYSFNGSVLAIEIHVFRGIFAIIGPYPNHIPLVGDYIVEFILFKEAF